MTIRGAFARSCLHPAAETGTTLRDQGDAPDTGTGTARGNYQTLGSDNGPSHGVVNGLLLGTRIAGTRRRYPNVSANGDDLGIDDEDGVANPLSDLVLTVGTQPTVTLRATNTTGRSGTLWGWIDFNADGVFDNATERVSVPVPTGAVNQPYTLSSRSSTRPTRAPPTRGSG